MGRGVAGLPGDFPKTRPATSREMPLAAQRKGMGRAEGRDEWRGSSL